MGLLRDFLMDKKFFEAIDEVEQFLIDNEIDKSSLIQSLIFDKVTFPEEEDARLWAREHNFLVETVEANQTSFIIDQLDMSEFITDTLTSAEISNGVIAIVGMLKPDEVAIPNVFLSLRNSDETIKFREDLPHIIELAKVVKGFHAAYGEVEITEEHLQSFARNFTDRTVGVDLMIDYDHDQSEAAGWIKSVYLSLDKQTLLGEIKWTPKGAQKLSDRSFRYFSPEFTLNYTHPHTGVVHGPTLLGGGLVNRPFLKMEAIVSFKETNNINEVTEMETIKLSEHQTAVTGLEKTITELKLDAEKTVNVVQGQKDEITTLSEEVKNLKTEKEVAAKNAQNEKLFSDGKISKAQLDALTEGKDLYEVLEMGEKLNVNPKGKTESNEPAIQLSEDDQRACKAMGVSAEDFAKYN